LAKDMAARKALAVIQHAVIQRTANCRASRTSSGGTKQAAEQGAGQAAQRKAHRAAYSTNGSANLGTAQYSSGAGGSADRSAYGAASPLAQVTSTDLV
jgi:hypothetical protein